MSVADTAQKKPLDLTISIAHWNTPELLKTCLERLVATTPRISYEVFIEDNDSKDKASFERVASAYRDDPRFTFIRNDRNIASLAHNPCFARGKGRYFAIVCPDAHCEEGCLDILVDFLDAHPEAGAVTPVLLNPDGSFQMYYRRMLTPMRFPLSTDLGQFFDSRLFGGRHDRYYRYDDLDVTRISEVEQPSAPCFLFRPEALPEGYVYDPRLPTYFADVDISKRIADRGYKIYLVPDARLIHHKSASFKIALDAWRRREYFQGLVVYFKKHHPLSLPFILAFFSLNRAAQWLNWKLSGKPMSL